MKKYFAVPLAVLFVAACSDSTSPTNTVNATPRYAKPTPPPTGGCTTCSIDGFYNFDGGVVGTSGGTTVATELQPGAAGTADAADVVTAPSGQKYLGRFTNTLTAVIVNVPAGGARYILNFDFYTIGSWDGRGKQAQHGVFDANVFDISYRCSTAGAQTSVFKTSFSNQLTVQQDYPQAYLAGGNKAATGAFITDALQYAAHPELSNTPLFRSFGDVSYHMTFQGVNPCGGTSAVTFIISTSNPTQQSVYDESWGVDNIHVQAGA